MVTMLDRSEMNTVDGEYSTIEQTVTVIVLLYLVTMVAM